MMKASVTVMLRAPADLRVLSKDIEPRYAPLIGETVEVPGMNSPRKVVSVNTDFEENMIDVSLEEIDFENDAYNEDWEDVFDACIEEGWTELEAW